MLVLVTGASGQTGSIVVRRLLERGGDGDGVKDSFAVRALVRSEESEQKLRANLGEELARSVEFVRGDATKPESLRAAFQGVEGVVMATGSMPRLDKASLACAIVTKLLTFGFVSRKPSFFFSEGQSPEQVDWIAQREQINAAKAAGAKHVVLISSMGGTKPDHFLNTQMDNVVLWKRRAECHLLASGLPYSIIHPGGLLPQSKPGGRRQLYAGVDDMLMDDERKISTVPREDLAEVCVHCLLFPNVSKGRTFDLGSTAEADEEHPVDLNKLLAPLDGKNCTYKEADANFKS